MEKKCVVKRVLLLVILSSLNHLLLGQTAIIEGQVYDELSKPLDFCNIQLFYANDSSFVKGGSFIDGLYEFKDISPGKYLLRISNVQYQTKDTIVNIHADINTIEPLILNGLQLGEVLVFGNVPVIKQNNGNYVINVNNSYLKNEPTVTDILRRSPGVLVDNNLNITIFDKESTSIYINDKEIRSKSELDLLQPDRIESIEIMRNPSSKYSSNTNAVILITTVKQLNDVFRISLTNNSYIGRKYSDMINLSMISKVNRISNTFNYSYSKFNNKIKDVSNSSIFRAQDTTYMSRQTTNNWTKESHNIFYSFDYDINNKNSIGIQYTGFIIDDQSKRDNAQQIFSNGVDDVRSFLVDDQIDDYLHNLNANYKQTFSKKTDLLLLIDYAISGQKMNSNVKYKDVLNNSSSSYKDKYHILSTEAKFSSAIKGFNYDIGMKYSSLRDNSEYKYTNELNINELNDQIFGAYVSAKKSISTLAFDLGMRVEYTSSKITFNGDYSNINDYYWDFFPNINISNKFSNIFTASLAYSRKINRPAFSRLNPRYKYIDAFSYMVGNPALNPAYNNLFELNLGISKLNASVSYSIIDDYVANVNIVESDESDVIKYTYANLDKAKFLTASLYYTYDYRKYSSMVGIVMKKPFIKIPYLNTSYNVTKSLYQVQYSGNLNILKETSLTGSFIYRSSGEDATLKFRCFNNLSLGINQYFFNKKLFISVTVSDILNRFKTNNWENRTGNVLTSMDSNQDSRKCCLTIKYTFGNLRYNTSKKTSNSENINRR